MDGQQPSSVVMLTRATREGSPKGAFLGRKVEVGHTVHQ